MSIDGISLLMDPTSVAWTGGTATSFETDGTPVTNGIHVADMSESDFRVRTHVTYKNRNPVRQADGTFSKGKKDIILTIPFELASGDISYQVVRIGFEIHPEFTGLDNLRHLAGQAVLDAEVDNFFVYGSVK